MLQRFEYGDKSQVEDELAVKVSNKADNRWYHSSVVQDSTLGDDLTLVR
jgi:hypothetical protein